MQLTVRFASVLFTVKTYIALKNQDIFLRCLNLFNIITAVT